MSPEEIAAAKRELAALYPQPILVKFGNLEWAIAPMQMERLARFLSPVLPIMPSIMASIKATPAGDELALALVPVFIQFAGSHRSEFFEALAVAIDKPPELIEMLPPGVLPGLLTAVYKANEDFFVRSLADLASANTATTSNGAGAKGGPTHSTSSLPTGTATQ